MRYAGMMVIDRVPYWNHTQRLTAYSCDVFHPGTRLGIYTFAVIGIPGSPEVKKNKQMSHQFLSRIAF